MFGDDQSVTVQLERHPRCDMRKATVELISNGNTIIFANATRSSIPLREQSKDRNSDNWRFKFPAKYFPPRVLAKRAAVLYVS